MLTHKGTGEIRTKQLILRRFRMEDADAMFHNWASDDEVTKYLSWPTHNSPEVSKYVLKGWVGNYHKDDFYLWAIEYEGQAIGSISVIAMDKDVEKAEIGYCIGQNWWHRGIMSEALQAVMVYLFDEVGFNRLEACHDPRNPNSGRVMAKCSMSYEATLRQAGRNNQGICDVSIYALLKCDR